MVLFAPSYSRLELEVSDAGSFEERTGQADTLFLLFPLDNQV